MGRRPRRGDDVGPHVGDGPRRARGHSAELLAKLEKDPRVRDAGAVAYLFGIDPVLILEERSALRRLLRLAAHNAVQDERNRAHDAGQRRHD